MTNDFKYQNNALESDIELTNSDCVTWRLPEFLYGSVDISCCLSKTSSNVTVNMKIVNPRPATFYHYDWVMELQIHEAGNWRTFASRTGYITETSPSNRTFTNVGRHGDLMRVKVTFRAGSTSVGTYYSFFYR